MGSANSEVKLAVISTNRGISDCISGGHEKIGLYSCCSSLASVSPVRQSALPSVKPILDYIGGFVG